MQQPSNNVSAMASASVMRRSDVLISLAKRNRSYSMVSSPATAMALSARKPSCKLVHGLSAMDRSTEFLIATFDTLGADDAGPIYRASLKKM